MRNRALPSPLPFVGAALIILALSCGEEATQPADTPGEPGISASYQGLVDLLLAGGLDVVEIGIVDLPCLGVRPLVLLAGGGAVEVYEYSNPASKNEAMVNITHNYASLEGLPAHIVVRFSHAHFYDSEMLLVRFGGANPVVEELLESALGAEFADGNSVIRC